jgi:YVTN family beta-propeller protein
MEAPKSLIFSPSGNYLYVAENSANGNVSVINTSSNQVIANVPNIPANGIAISNKGNLLYVSAGNTISVLSTSSNKLVANISLPNSWAGGPLDLEADKLELSPNGNFLYSADAEGFLSVVNTSTNQAVARVHLSG